MEYSGSCAQLFHYQMFCGEVADDPLAELVYTCIIPCNWECQTAQMLYHTTTNKRDRWHYKLLLGHCHRDIYSPQLGIQTAQMFHQSITNKNDRWQYKLLLGHCHRDIYSPHYTRQLGMSNCTDTSSYYYK